MKIFNCKKKDVCVWGCVCVVNYFFTKTYLYNFDPLNLTFI